MSWCLKLGRAAGVDVYLHWTFFLAPIFVVYSCRSVDWVVISLAMVLMLAFFGCIVLHEFGHALAARRFAIQTRCIVITPIGGLAMLEKTRITPLQELLITLAGPAVNLAIAGILLVYLLVTGKQLVPAGNLAGFTAFPQVLMIANAGLFLFNLLPAFPMDGGRVLRSALAMIIDFHRATIIAVGLGRAIALVFVVVGVYLYDFAFGILGVFIFLAAGIELAASRAAVVSELRYLEPQLPFQSDKS